jgi:hypothetical protein
MKTMNSSVTACQFEAQKWSGHLPHLLKSLPRVLTRFQSL